MDASTHIRGWWSENRRNVLRAAVVMMAVYATAKIGSEYFRLLFDHGFLGALDLRFRHEEVERWFAYLPVYPGRKLATYPPGSYVVFWLALGWAPLDVCRWLWAMASTLSLSWLCWITVRDSTASSRLERIFAALLPLSINGTGIGIGNGQLAPLLVPMIWTGMLLLVRLRNGGWRRELAIVILLLLSLVQPTIAAPFFWIALFVPSRIRPALWVILGYLAMTLLAAWFQPDDLFTLLRDWIRNAGAGPPGLGSTDLHRALYLLGLKAWIFPVSAVVILALGRWVFVHRRGDIHLLLGVTAIVARVWTYHGLYDNLLLIFPMIALIRIAKRLPHDGNDIRAGLLLALTVLVLLLPARMFHFWGQPWSSVFALAQAVSWLAVLIFLLMQAHTQRLASARQAVTLASPNLQAKTGP